MPLRVTATFPLSSSFKGNYLTSIVLPLWGRISGHFPFSELRFCRSRGLCAALRQAEILKDFLMPQGRAKPF